MLLSYKELAIGLIVFFCTLFCVFTAWKKPHRKSNRTRVLWKLVVLNAFFFSVGLVALVIELPLSILDILSWVVYDLVITFVFCLEIPAYIKISNFDENLVDVLKGLREILIKMPFSFRDSLQALKAKKNDSEAFLKGENLDKLLDDFISFCDKVENLNDRLWSLTANETSSYIDEVSNRSKHPFPKLIDILALSGLSFLLAQFLKLLG
jgi:hypothetical protein